MPKPTRGEVWQVRFRPAVGAEIQKERPAVVLNPASIGRLPLTIVVPITEWKTNYDQYSWFVPLQPSAQNGLTKESGADAFQVKSVSDQRLIRRLGQIERPELAEIAKAVAVCVGCELTPLSQSLSAS